MPLHAYTRTHMHGHIFCVVLVRVSIASVCSVRTCVVISKAEQRESERRRDCGCVRDKEGEGERGAMRECVCEREGARWHARSQERERV